jgi:hypothetical protein
VARQFFGGFGATVAFVVVIALLLMGIFIAVNFVAGPVGG